MWSLGSVLESLITSYDFLIFYLKRESTIAPKSTFPSHSPFNTRSITRMKQQEAHQTVSLHESIEVKNELRYLTELIKMMMRKLDPRSLRLSPRTQDLHRSFRLRKFPSPRISTCPRHLPRSSCHNQCLSMSFKNLHSVEKRYQLEWTRKQKTR